MDNTAGRSFTDLPEPMLYYIGTFLPITDVMKLSMTCGRFRDILPKYLLMTGPDIAEYEDTDDPKVYFDGPILKECVRSIDISMLWNDQVSYIHQKDNPTFL